MFPNVRLIVVTILAAIAGIGCGLGLFATFRVNHEPLVRLAEGRPPLQLGLADLALGSNTALVSNPRAPMQARLPVSSAATVISVPVIVAIPGPTAEQAEGAAAPAGDNGVEQAAVGAGAADQSEQSNTASLAAAVGPEQSSVTPEPTAVATSQQAPIAAAQDQQPAAPAATTPTGEQTAATNPANDPERESKPTATSESKAAKPKARAAHPGAQVRRAAKTVRTRRTGTTVTQSVYQYSQPTYSQSTYTWTDGSVQVSQPVKRVQIKRHRTAKKALPAAQFDPSTTTAGLSGA